MRLRARPVAESFEHPESAVEIPNLKVDLRGTPILEVSDVKLKPGQALAITGRNGVGKTTLLRVVSGTAKPSAGKVKVLGMVPDERSTPFRKQVATGLSVPPLATDLTLIEHLMLIGTSWGLNSGQAKENVHEILRQFDVDYIAQHYPHEISSGERQVFSLAMVLCRPSKLLILDEPERHLDTGRINTLSEVLKQYMHDGGAVLVASHSAQLVKELECPVLELHRPGSTIPVVEPVETTIQ
jgi:ABC-2 type transport system ATP-binding protein